MSKGASSPIMPLGAGAFRRRLYAEAGLAQAAIGNHRRHDAAMADATYLVASETRYHRSNVYLIQASADGKHIATAGYDGTIRIWE